jgi:hypothetical protein
MIVSPPGGAWAGRPRLTPLFSDNGHFVVTGGGGASIRAGLPADQRADLDASGNYS